MTTFAKKYNPDRSSDWNYGGAKWRLSRSKIDLYVECPRCFYADNKLGTKRPSFPAFNLNLAVDELFKKEFDTYRKTGTKHPLQEKYKVDAVPFAHRDIDLWRDNFSGLEHQEKTTGLVVSGAIDDVWVTPAGTLIVIDYKSTSKAERIEVLGDSPWEKQYQRQLGVYRWLLEQNGFKVEATGYLVYANADKTTPSFGNQLSFETTLVPVVTETEWILPILGEIKQCLDSDLIPKSGENCEFCPYREAVGKKLQALHKQAKK